MLPGGTQVSTVESRPPAPFFRSVAQIGRQAAQGLAYAHARGIVHRDIKPSNLLLDTAGVVWITDFGLAKAEEDGLTPTGDILGTLRYMAPERFRGEGDARADVYALGLTLYELLTLRPAFDSSDRLRLIEQIKDRGAAAAPVARPADPARPGDDRPQGDREGPGARYQTAEAMAEDLRRFLADEPIQARQVSAVGADTGGGPGATRRSRRCGGGADGSAGRDHRGLDHGGGLLQGIGQSGGGSGQERADRQPAIAAGPKERRGCQGQAILERDNSRQVSAGLALDAGSPWPRRATPTGACSGCSRPSRPPLTTRDAFRRHGALEPRRVARASPQAAPISDPRVRATWTLFSPDGRTFATVFSEVSQSIAGPIDFFDTATAAKLRSLPRRIRHVRVPLGRQGPRRERRQPGCLSAIDLVTGRELWTTPHLPGRFTGAVSFSPDGSTMHVCRYERYADAWLIRLDAVTGRQLGETAHYGGRIALAPDGRSIASSRIEDGEAYVDLNDLPSGRRSLVLSERPAGRFRSGVPPGWEVAVRVGHRRKTRSSSVHLRPDLGRRHRQGDRPAHAADEYRRLHALGRSSRDGHREHPGRTRCRRPGEGLGVPATTPARGPRLSAHPDGRTMVSVTSDRGGWIWQISTDAEPLRVRRAGDESSSPESTSGVRARDSDLPAGLREDGMVAVSLATDAGGRDRHR